MPTLITGLGLVGTAYAQLALKRGENIIFYDVAPRKDFLANKLGPANVTVVQGDVRDLPALVETIQKHKVDKVIHTAGLIGGKVAQPIYTGMQINVMGTINVAEAVRLTGVKRLVQISTFGIYDRRNGEPGPIDESFHRGPGEPYGNSKVAKELMVEAYGDSKSQTAPGLVTGVQFGSRVHGLYQGTQRTRVTTDRSITVSG